MRERGMMESTTPRSVLQKLPSGVCIYRGSTESRHLAPEVMAFLKQALYEGENLRFRNINELYAAFDKRRCVYAADISNAIVGFYYFNVKETAKKCVVLSALVVAISFRKQGIGRRLRAEILELIEENYLEHDIISFTSNPIVMNWNQKRGCKEVSYSELWEVYGINVVRDCVNHPNIACRFKKPFSQSNIFENVEIFHTRTKHTLKSMILHAPVQR